MNAHAARPAELPPFGDELAARRQYLQAVVGTVADEDASGRVDRQRMGIVELPGTGAGHPECLDELPILRQMDDPAV